MTVHQHTAEHRVDLRSKIVEVCDCGATREIPRGATPSPWHTCAACTHPYGLDRPEVTP